MKIYIANALAVCDKHGLFLQTDPFLIPKVVVFQWYYFGLKTSFFMLSECNFSTLIFKCNENTLRFLMFSGCRERVHWERMG